MAGERILVIDDDPSIGRLLEACLSREGFSCTIAATGEAGLQVATQERPALVILDLTLPGIDGLEVCRTLKADPGMFAVPIVMLTGRDDEADVVQGLEMGADDYIVKPFSSPVLIARVRTVLRRHAGDAAPVDPARQVSFHGLTLDSDRGKAVFNGRPLPLSLPETRFLALLLASAGEDPGDGTATEPFPSRLEQEGMPLFVLGRLERILRLLGEFPEHVLADSPWLGFYAALARLRSGQGDPRSLLETARAGFRAAGRTDGELLASAHLLYSELLFGEHPVAELERRTTELVAAHADTFTVCSRLQVYQCLAAAQVLTPAGDGRSHDWTAEAIALAERNDLGGPAVLGHVCRGEKLLRRGEVARLRDVLEAGYPALCRGLGLAPDRALARLLELKYFLLTGDRANRDACLTKIRAEIDGLTWQRSVLGGQLDLWQAAAKLLDGAETEALALCRKKPAAARHRRVDLDSTALRLLATARRDERKDALRTLPSALKMLDEHPDPYARAWNGALVGAAAGHLGASDQAARALETARRAAARLRNGHLAGFLDVVEAVLLPGDGPVPLETLRTGLEGLDQTGQELRLICSDEGLAKVLQAVLDVGDEGLPLAERLAALLGLITTASKEVLPPLELQMLGRCQICFQGRVAVRLVDLTPAQRELLAVLVATPDMKISQEEVQLDFWPDSSPERARSNFDSLLLRLRKSFDQAVAPYSVKHYLQLQKGILVLQNVRVDAHELLAHLREGIEHSRRRETWQAGNHFGRALEIWNGPYMPGASARDQAARFSADLERCFVEGMLVWSRQLIDLGRSEEAVEILHRVLPVDPINDSLIKMLCRGYLRCNQFVRARRAVARYAEELCREDYAPEEIREIISSFPAMVQDDGAAS